MSLKIISVVKALQIIIYRRNRYLLFAFIQINLQKKKLTRLD